MGSCPKFMLKNSYTVSATPGTFSYHESPPRVPRHASPSTGDDNDDDGGLENPFLKWGPPERYRMVHVDKVLHIRIDLPWCSNKDLHMWVDGDMVHFLADAPPDHISTYPGRHYGGSFVLNPELHVVDEAKGEIVNGVFKLTIPKRPNA